MIRSQTHPDSWGKGSPHSRSQAHMHPRPYVKTEWFLLQKTGTISFRLTTSDVILIGREKCDINIQSPGVEKRHAVLSFDPRSECFTVTDLKTRNGTFLNSHRIPTDRPEKLFSMDLLRFGYDSNVYEIRSGNQSVSTGAGAEGHERLTGVGASANSSPTSDPDSSIIPERFSHVMQNHRGNSFGGSRVSSPSLTLDSGRGSSSAPSSPAKEMSPVPNSTSSNSASPTFHRKMKHFPELYRRNSSNKLASEVVNNVLLVGVNGEDENERIRKDSLEDETEDNTMIPNLTARESSAFLSSLEPDISVPNEVFQPQQLHHDLKSSTPPNIASPSSTSEALSGNEVWSGLISEVMSRSRSFSGGGSSALALSTLYGTPHWWPDAEHLSSSNNLSNFSLNGKSQPEPKGAKETDGQEKADGGSSVSSEKDQSLKSGSDSGGSKKLSPMAFTVDFGETASCPKKLFGIADSISKFAPRHRRNFSLTKGEDLAEKEKDSLKETDLPLPPKKETTPTAIPTLQSKVHQRKSPGAEIPKNSNTASKSVVDSVISSNTSSTSTSTSVSTRRALHELPSRKVKSSKPTKATIMPSLLTQQQVPKAVTDIRNTTTTAVVKNICNNDLSINTNAMLIGVPAESIENRPSKTSEVKVDQDGDDNNSETGTYTIEKDAPEVQKARKNIENIFGMENPKSDKRSEQDSVPNEKTNNGLGVGTGTPGWVREWAELAAQQHQQEGCASNNELHPASETQFFLQETQNVVSAMQERVSQRLSNNNSAHNSDSDDEATLSYSPPKVLNPKSTEKNRPLLRTSPLPREASVLSDSGYALGYQSDSSNEGSRDYKSIGVKYNKAFNIRRSRVVGYESDGCATVMNRQSMTLPVRGVSPRPQPGSTRPTTSSLFTRNDGGRFSLRMPKSRTPVNQMAPPPPPPVQVLTSHPGSNKGDLSSKKQNPPPGMNRKPPVGSRSNSTLTAKEVELANWKRRKSYDPMKAAAEGKKNVKKSGVSGSESAAEEVVPVTHTVDLTSMAKSTSFHSGYSGGNSEDEDIVYVVDELESSHSNSPNHLVMTRSLHEDNLYYGLSHPSLRPKNKLEALDNLVIATIHSLSVKVRSASRQLLEKLQVQHANDENGALLEEMVSQLRDLEALNGSSPNKSPSRELSGTLKNLKKLEQVILVLDRVLCDDLGSEMNV